MAGTFQRYSPCPQCRGTGECRYSKNVSLTEKQVATVYFSAEKCRVCNGTGQIDIVDQINTEIRSTASSIVLLKWGMTAICAVILLIGTLATTNTGFVGWFYATVAMDLFLILVTLSEIKSKKATIVDDYERIDIILHMEGKRKNGHESEPLHLTGKTVDQIDLQNM